MPISAPIPAAAPLSHASSVPQRNVMHVGVLLVLVGLLFVGLALLAPELLLATYALVASPDTPSSMGPSARFGAALFGALTMGWGATLHQLGAGASLDRAVIAGTITWFVVDSTASVMTGYAGNVLLNISVTVLVVWLLRRGTR